MMQMQLLPKKVSKKLLVRLVAALGIILFPVVVMLAFFLQYHGRVYPNIVLANNNIGGMTPEEAKKSFSQNFLLPASITLEHAPEQTHVIPSSSIKASVNYEASVSSAFNHGRSGVIWDDLRTIFLTLRNGAQYEPVIEVDSLLLEEQLAAYAESITTPSIEPSIQLINNEIVVNPGESGTEIDLRWLKDKIVLALQKAEMDPIKVAIIPQEVTLNEQEVLNAKLRAQKMLDKKFTLNFEHQSFEFTEEQLIAFIDPKDGYKDSAIYTEVEKISKAVNREAQNPVFAFQDGKVQEFKPSKDGVKVKDEELVALIIDSLQDLEQEDFDEIAHSIPVSTTPPAISMENVNNLGIKELIGRGTSTFRGSIPSRVYNINLAASRLNGILIKPGEEFSFNGALGDVSALTGYKQAYVIQGGRTVLGDGGGVCQVSTTFFRAALNAGLPILERNPHSYRVSYYEQDSGPGLDASIYTPTLDLKVKNDTPGHILVQAMPDTTNMTLVFELYGTKDGRVATVGEPIITSQSAPPEPLYIDDPTLPAGQIKQIDYAAWGAKAQFSYKVTRGDEVLIDKVFYSNYRPWQAKFLRGTGPTT